jgi:hypothetical protein
MGRPGKPRRNKYNATPTRVEGRRFDSRREADRYAELRLLERAGEIRGLEVQCGYDLRVGGVLVCRYVADFRYADARTGETVVEDAKGFRTREYRIKKKLMLALHGVRIMEV